MRMACLMAALVATVVVEAQWARPDLVEKVARGELAEAETNSVSMVAGDTVRCIPRVISGLLP